MWLLQRTPLLVDYVVVTSPQCLREAPTCSDTLPETRQDNMSVNSVPDIQITDTEYLRKLH
jgi:hypothetical protein